MITGDHHCDKPVVTNSDETEVMRRLIISRPGWGGDEGSHPCLHSTYKGKVNNAFYDVHISLKFPED